MDIRILAVGKSKDYLGQDIVSEFTSRLVHYTDIDWTFIPNIDVDAEGEKMLKLIPTDAFVVMLDDKGRQLTSLELADFLQKKQNESLRNMVFVIGGAYGFSDTVKKRANYALSLSKLTFPHEFVRAILSEALYRAFTITKGEKYHHE
mgnify:CR=1 FL=1